MIQTLFNKNINSLLDYKFTKIGLAVSGGSDSIALLMLSSVWSKQNDITLSVFSVNHNTRVEIKKEMSYVSELSKKLGHKHYILNFDHKNNFSNFQARARTARYQLIASLCIELDILIVMTGHHLDDYIENYCIRNNKKSGVFGLSASNAFWIKNVKIIRPLYNLRKKLLQEFLIKNNIKWFEDKSNLCDKYLRNIIRKDLKLREEFREVILNKITNTTKYVTERLQKELIECIAESVKIYEFGFSTINLYKLLLYRQEIIYQVINFILIIISGRSMAPRAKSVLMLLKLLKNRDDCSVTLNGCSFRKKESNLIVLKEIGRIKPDNTFINNKKEILWDNRFKISLSQKVLNSIDNEYYVTYLTEANYRLIKSDLNLEELKKTSFNNQISILFTLPIIKKFEKIIAMPSLSYYNDESFNNAISISFEPGFISRFTHFC